VNAKVTTAGQPSGRPDTLVSARGLRKTYGHVEALRGVDLDIARGEVVALVGDNGAGKSTLVACISGAIEPDAGSVTIGGREVALGSIDAAADAGIATVYQDLALTPDLSVFENLFLSREPVRRGVLGRFGMVDKAQMRRRSRELVAELGVALPSVEVDVASLSGGQRQVVAIARAVAWATEMIIMDEPTAALGVRQSGIVLDSIRAATGRGLSVLLVSHDLPRVLEVAHRIVIMRLGRLVASLDARRATIQQVVEIMLGADVDPALESGRAA
jgi:ABC-type sugar transport system ATPase subunit